jgi:bifunctional non-homologous end joining protein LigD
VLSLLREPIREFPVLEARLSDLIRSVKAQGLEGIVAKRIDSRYEPGQRSGAWQKMRVNQGQEFAIGGYTPASRDELFRRFHGLASAECPFVNLPEARSGRWGQGLTADKMTDCRWLKPVLVGQIEFVEWTQDGHLRHADS